MAEKLFVHADLGRGTCVLAGQLIVDDQRGRFKYSPKYLSHPRSFALDPINLPLTEEVHTSNRTREAPGVFGVI